MKDCCTYSLLLFIGKIAAWHGVSCTVYWNRTPHFSPLNWIHLLFTLYGLFFPKTHHIVTRRWGGGGLCDIAFPKQKDTPVEQSVRLVFGRKGSSLLVESYDPNNLHFSLNLTCLPRVRILVTCRHPSSIHENLHTKSIQWFNRYLICLEMTLADDNQNMGFRKQDACLMWGFHGTDYQDCLLWM
jgi:hypothetical protein